jgi:hypothetical protein
MARVLEPDTGKGGDTGELHLGGAGDADDLAGHEPRPAPASSADRLRASAEPATHAAICVHS